MAPSLIAQLLADTGASSQDRITSNSRLRISGLKPGAQYQTSIDSGQTWSNPQSAPLAKSKALLFDGANDFVSIPDNSSLPSGNNSYTLEAWIKPDAMGDRGIIGWGPWGSQSQVNALRLMGSGKIRHYWWSNDLDVNVGNLADGKWHHVAATFDGKTRKVYVDGVLKGSDVPAAHRVPVVAKNVRIGSTNNGEYFKGSIDDAAIWRRSLTQEEITQRQNAKPDTSDKDLVLFYGFDEGVGNVVAASGAGAKGLQGTLVNGPTWTSRDIVSADSAGTVEMDVEIPHGIYQSAQVRVRDVSSQETVSVGAFQVDTQAPKISLNIPGGADATISSQLNDDLISGLAEPGKKLTLMSRLGTVPAGNLKITADNGADIYLNGQLVGKTSDWTKPYDFTGLNVQAGQNVLSVLAYDVGGIAGLSGRFEVPSGTFGTSDLAGWKVLNVDPEPSTDNSTASRDPKQWKLPADWTSVGFDDRTWSSAVNVQAKTGQYPWGNRTGDPTWIWSDDPNNHDVVLFRYTFNGANGDVGQVVIADNIQVADDGKFNHKLTADQLKQLGEGTGRTLTAVQTDEAGNIGRSTQATFAIDTVGHPVTISSIGGGDSKVSNDLVETGRGPLQFQLDQYTGYWSTKLSDLQNYVKNFNPITQKNRYSVLTDVIDYTDDRAGFAGELPYDRRWPAAEATNTWTTGGINNQFFVKISGDFYITDPGKYRFRTYNDDGVFLLIDGKLVINDPTLHPERVLTGDLDLSVGNHSLELFFFENGGEASCEFSVSRFDPSKNSWGPYQLMGKDPLFQSKSVVVTDNLVTGKGAPNSQIFFRIGNNEIGSTITDASGAFSYTLTPANLTLLSQLQGSAELIAYQRDAAGNLSSSAPGPVALKEKPPLVAIDSIGNQDKTVSSLSGDADVVGRGEANLSTTLRSGDIVLGEVKADAQGRFVYKLTSENIDKLGQGANKSIVATQATASGLKGDSASFNFAVDTIAPVVTIASVGYGDARMSANSVELGKGPLETQLDQYTGFWSNNLAELRSYISGFKPSPERAKHSLNATSLNYTDDQKGPSGDFADDLRWPAAVASNTFGMTGINNQFFARFASDFSVEKPGRYRFKTANDDAAYLIVDGVNVIANSNSTSSETAFTGEVELVAGNHQLELFFVENAGKSSLELSVSHYDLRSKQWSPYKLFGQQSDFKSRSNLQPDNLITGTAEAGRDVLITLGTTELGRSRADELGNFSLNLTSQALAELDRASRNGPVSINAIQTDAVGNVGNSGPTAASVRLTPPVMTANRFGGDDGVVSSQISDLAIEGTAEAGLSLSMVVDGQVMATIDSINSDGRFSYALTSADIDVIGQGINKTLQLRQQDLYGNIGTFTTVPFAVDTIAPIILIPPSKDPNALGGTDGVVSSQVGDATLLASGEANTQVSLKIGNLTRSVIAEPDGRFVFGLGDQDIEALGQGVGRQITLVQTDLAGNVATKTFSVDVDTIAPDQPVVQSLATDGYVSGRPNDNIIFGQADPNSLVSLYLNNSVLATSKTNSKGEFNYSITQPDIARFGQGTFKFNASISDVAGNVASSTSQDLIIDTIAPPRPTLGSIGGEDRTISTKDSKVTGKGEAKSLISLYYGDKLLGTSTADDFGNFDYGLTSSNIILIGQGASKRVQIIASDLAGNSSVASEPFTFSIDTVPPASPTIRSIGGTDGVISTVAGDNTIDGLGEVGIELSLKASNPQGIIFEIPGVVIDSRGTWRHAFTPQQIELLNASQGAITLQALTKDKAGNEGQSISISPKLDLKSPEIINLQLGGSDLTVSSVVGDNLLTAKGEANRPVVISLAGRVLSTVVSSANGIFSYSLSPADVERIGQGANKKLEITQSDTAGNVTLSAIPFSVDTVPPTVAVIDSIGGADKIVTSSQSDRVVRGRAEAGSNIILRAIAGTLRTPLTSITVGKDGTYQHILTPENLTTIAQGVGKAIEVVSTDQAGNQSVSKPFAFQVEALWKTGTAGNDQLVLASGIDAITGLNGADRFVLPTLGSGLVVGSTLPSFDRILDFQMGVDVIDAPIAVSPRNTANLGSIQGLSNTHLVSKLSTTVFPANSAALFTYNDFDGTRTFVAINDASAGYQQAKDAVIEVTGYFGLSSALNIV